MHAGTGLLRRRAGLATSLLASLIETCCRAPSSLGTTSSLLASGCSLKTASASQTMVYLQRKNGTGTSGTLLATTGAVSLTMLLADKMRQGSVVSTWQTIAFLEGTTIELFIQYAHVGVINIVKIWSKTTEKGWFAARWTRLLVVSLAVSRFSVFAPVTSAKNKGLARKLDKILTCSFLFSVWSISSLFNKKAQVNTCLAGALPDFGLDNLLNEGVLMLC